MKQAQKYAKFIAAMLTVLVTSGVGLIPGEYTGWLQLVIALVGAFAVYQVENVDPDAPEHLAE